MSVGYVYVGVIKVNMIKMRIVESFKSMAESKGRARKT